MKERMKQLLELLMYRISKRIPFAVIIYDALDIVYELSEEIPYHAGKGIVTDGVRLYVTPTMVKYYDADSMFMEIELLHQLFHVYLGHPIFADESKREEHYENCDWEIRRILTWVYFGLELDEYKKTSIIFHKYREAISRDHDLWYESDKHKTDEIMGADNQHPESGMNAVDSNKAEAKKLWEKLRQNVKDACYIGYGYDSMTGDINNNFQGELIDESIEYKDVLKSYFVIKEQTCDTDKEIDVMLYTYGFSLYDNITLVEPPEVVEEPEINIYIAIDTSGSCDGELVKRFLSQTYEVVSQFCGESRNTVDMYLMLCDTSIAQEFHITSVSDFPKLEDIIISGGGTDFRPVFDRVNELHRESGTAGPLFYYTDGEGLYPEHVPDYDTYFVVDGDNVDRYCIPEWIRILDM